MSRRGRGYREVRNSRQAAEFGDITDERFEVLDDMRRANGDRERLKTPEGKWK